MARNGRLQNVQLVDQDSDDESSSSGPPPLEDLDELNDHSSTSTIPTNAGTGTADPGLPVDSDEPPALESDGQESDSGSYYDEDEDEAATHSSSSDSGPPEPSDDEIPNLTGGSESMSESDEDDEDASHMGGAADSDGPPPDLDDPESEGGSDSEEDGMPELEMDSHDESGDDSDDDQDQQRGPGQSKLKSGFLNKGKQKKSSSGYSNAGVGQREEGPAAAAARKTGSRSSAPYSGAGSGAREDVRGEPHPYGRSKGQQPGMTPDESAEFLRPQMAGSSSAAAAAAAAGAVPQQRRSTAERQWTTNQQPRKKKKEKAPEPTPSNEPAKPAEVVMVNEAIKEREREMEELRRRWQMQREEANAAPVPVGRCCLNRGVADTIASCTKSAATAQVWPADRRMHMRCSAGCSMVWHQECWRKFQELYDKETSINLTHALRVRDKSKPPLVHCVTPGCPGYVNFLGCFDGPVGHETFKSMQYQPTQEHFNLIKAAQDEDLEAAKQQAAAARAAAKKAADEAAMEAWKLRTNWRPKGPKKPRSKAPKRQELANGGSAFDSELMSFLDKEGARKKDTTQPTAEELAAKAAADKAAAEAAEKAAAPKPAGITIKNRAIKPIIVRKDLKLDRQEADTGSPSAASVEGSASASQTASQSQNHREADPLEQLGTARASDHIDRTYHTSVEDMMQQQAAAAADSGKKGKKKKGITLHITELQTVQGAEEYMQSQAQSSKNGPQHLISPGSTAGSSRQAQQRQQQQPQQQRVMLADFPSLDQAAAMGDEVSVPERDYLMEALNKLKLGVSETDITPHVLLECVDYYMMVKNDKKPKDVITELVKEKSGEEPVFLWLFEKQEAVAVTMASKDKAYYLYVYLNNHHLYRKPLKPSYLRQPPYDDVLHDVCPEYESAAMRADREMREAMEDTAAAGGSSLNTDRLKELADQVKAGLINPTQLLEMLEKDTQQQPQQQQATQQDKQQKKQEQQQKQKQQEKAGSGASSAAVADAAATAATAKLPSKAGLAAAAGAAAGAAAAAVSGGAQSAAATAGAAAGAFAGAIAKAVQAAAAKVVPPPRPPPGNPPPQPAQAAAAKVVPPPAPPAQRQQPPPPPQQQQRVVVQQQQPQPAVYQQPMVPVMSQPLVVQQMGYGMVPVVPAYGGMPLASMPGAVPVVMQPATPGGVYAQQQTWQQQTWQQQQQFGAAGASVEQQQQQHGVNGAEYAAVDQQGQGSTAADGDWAGDGEIYDEGTSSSNRTRYYDGGQPVDVADEEAEGEGGHEQEEEERQQQLQSMLESRGRSQAAGASAAEAARSMSGSPSVKLNPLAKEFKLPGATSATSTSTPSSRLANGSSSSTEASAGSGGSVISSSAAPAAASSSSKAAEKQAAAAAVAKEAAKAPAVAAKEAAAKAAGAAAKQEATKPAAPPTTPDAAGTAAGAASAASSSRDSSSSGAAAPAAAASQPAQEQQQRPQQQPQEEKAVSSQPAAATAGPSSSSSSSSVVGVRVDGLPADHVFDVVHLAGCNNMYLQQTFRNPNTPGFTLAHSSFTDSHKIAKGQTGGLIMFNVDTQKVEGLWAAYDNTPDGVQWRSVATYQGVPMAVYGQLVQLSPFKNHYPGEQGMAIIRALWKWAHPTPAPTPVAAAAAAPAAPVSTAVGTGGGSGDRVAAAPHAASVPNSRPPSSGPAAAAAPAAAGSGGGSGGGASGGGSRALPALLAMLANRPASAGSSSGAAPGTPPAAQPAATAAAAAPPATRPPAAAPAAPAAAACAASVFQAPVPARQSKLLKLCTVCHAHDAGWLVLGCKHFGPCMQCCPKPADLQDKFYTNPPEYPRCLAPDCGKPVMQLLRVVI